MPRSRKKCVFFELVLPESADTVTGGIELRDESGMNTNHTRAPAGSLTFRLLHEESGQDLIEYALICCFVALGAVASMKSLVTAILAVVSSLGSTLTTAT